MVLQFYKSVKVSFRVSTKCRLAKWFYGFNPKNTEPFLCCCQNFLQSTTDLGFAERSLKYLWKVFFHIKNLGLKFRGACKHKKILIQIYLIYKAETVCVYIYISSIEIQTAKLILVKFGTGIHLISWKVLSPNPQIRGNVCQPELCNLAKTYKTKVGKHPCFRWGGSHFWIQKDLGDLCLWHYGQAFLCKAYKTN